MRTFLFCSVAGVAVAAVFMPLFSVSAHEVYVLEPELVRQLVAGDSPNPFTLITTSAAQFFLWTFIAVATIVSVFLISLSRRIERYVEPFIFYIKKPYAILIGRVTLGLALLASGYYGALFGPELPLTQFVPESFVWYVQAGLMTIGLLLIVGFANRLTAGVAIALFVYALSVKGFYMLTYLNYLGEMILAVFLGAHAFSLDKRFLSSHQTISRVERFFETYAFLILRVAFGVSLIYASVYAKLLHSSLALHTVIQYNLTDYFHFAPLFIVLGAGLVEIVLGLFFIIGFEIRFAAIFLSIFLTLSLLYFGEAVWPHIILFGVAFALFVHGYDKFTLEGRLFKNAKREPFL